MSMTTLHEQWQKFEALVARLQAAVEVLRQAPMSGSADAIRVAENLLLIEAQALATESPAMLDHIRQCHAEMERKDDALRGLLRALNNTTYPPEHPIWQAIANAQTALNPKPEEV